MNTVILCENCFEPDTWETVACDSISALLASRFVKFPETARIYYKYVAESADVTPYDDASIERLEQLEGTFYVIVYPELPIWAVILIIAIAVAAVAILVIHFLKPSPSIPNTQQTSPNNSLTERSNQVRINQRIPDIFGEVQSIPDMIMVPYRIFVDNRELEIAYMCVGRGDYTVGSVGLLAITLSGTATNPSPGP